VIGRLHAASRRVTPLDRRDTNRGVRTQGTIELTKMSGYRPIRPYYDSHSRPSACPPVCLSVCPVRASSSKTERRKKSQIGANFSMAGLTAVPIFSSDGQRSKLRLWFRSALSSAVYR